MPESVSTMIITSTLAVTSKPPTPGASVRWCSFLLSLFSVSCLWVLLLLSHSVGTFNLEPRLAIVKKGTPGSYFGFSVSQHQIVTKDRIESVLLVGAPLEKGAGGGGSRWTPGAIWKCPFTARNEDCRVLEELTAKKKKILQKDDDGQWLGSVVYSQGPGK